MLREGRKHDKIWTWILPGIPDLCFLYFLHFKKLLAEELLLSRIYLCPCYFNTRCLFIRCILALILVFDKLLFTEFVRSSPSLSTWPGPHLAKNEQKTPAVPMKSPILSCILLFSHHLWSIPPCFAGSKVWYCFIRSKQKQKLRNLNHLIAHLSATKTRSEIIHSVCLIREAQQELSTMNWVDKAVLSISYHPHPCNGVKIFFKRAPDLTGKRRRPSAI